MLRDIAKSLDDCYQNTDLLEDKANTTNKKKTEIREELKAEIKNVRNVSNDLRLLRWTKV